MSIDGLPPEKSWLEKLLTGSSMVTIMVALIGQAIFSIVFQIRNNEQQSAGIELNRVAVANLRSEIVNLQTPLSTLVLRMDGRLSAMEAEHKSMDARLAQADIATNARLDTIDRGGTRAMEVVAETQKRVLATIDRMQERLNTTDAKISEVQGRGVLILQNQIDIIHQDIKRIDDAQGRILRTIEEINSFLKEYAHKPVPRQ